MSTISKTMSNKQAMTNGNSTSGGSYIEGNVIAGRDFVGRDKIIHLTIHFLRDSRQQLLVLGSLILITLGTYLVQWWNEQPSRMTGDFNIAVAEFTQLSATDTKIAAELSQALTDYLQSEYQLGNQTVEVQVTHKNIGSVSEKSEIETIARKTNAHLVIYGTVAVIGNSATLRPMFYVSQNFRQDTNEITHPEELAMAIPFSVTQTLDPNGVSAELRKRSMLLAEFTKGLVFGHSGNYNLALVSYEKAIAAANDLENLQGNETLYLFASDAARRLDEKEVADAYIKQALAINPNYARVYIALGNIQYDRTLLDEAQSSYEQALQMRPRDDIANIFAKAHLGIGNVYHNRGIRVPTGSEEQKRFFAKASEQFAIVIDAVEKNQHKWQPSWELVAHAQYGLGRISQTEGNLDAAEQAYRQALQWTLNAELRKAIEEARQKLRETLQVSERRAS